MKPLPCPFCGADAEVRWDAPEPRPFLVRCSQATCPGRTSVSFSDSEVAMERWNRRVLMPPPALTSIAHVAGFLTKNAIRGELVEFELDRTGVLVSDKMRFRPDSTPLMLKPRDA